ncbi:MAG: alpha/beta hydrolase-fold protein [Cyanobacteriota bacterium]|nr:alpha/beta hydrolase-fold protein [Cyanobacteriota bacterium]
MGNTQNQRADETGETTTTAKLSAPSVWGRSVWSPRIVGLWLIPLSIACSSQLPPTEPATSPTTANSLKPNAATSPSPPSPVARMTVTNATIGWNRNLSVDDVAYDLYLPPGYGEGSAFDFPCLLVLPGWDFPRSSWVENAPLVEYADRYGYALILPEMGQTLYESAYYLETELRWNAVPGGEFVKERLIPTLQNRHGLLRPGQHNALLGLSTGGRGVALIALENPGLFVVGASVSGDFSQENTPDDRLMSAVYGSFARFRERWTGRDNPQKRVEEWQMPLYLAHGTADDIVPESQSRLFYQALVKTHGDRIPIRYNPVEGAGHDYTFWGGQLDEIFEFLDRKFR